MARMSNKRRLEWSFFLNDRSLAEQYPDCTIAKGLAIAGTDAQNNPDKVQNSVANWLSELGF